MTTRLPSDLLDRGLVGVLDKARERSMPLKWETVNRPLGGGEHIVSDSFRVGSVAAQASFMPGSRVLVAAGLGDDALGRVVVGFSPPIQGGSAPPSTVHGNLSFGISPTVAYWGFFFPGDGTTIISGYSATGAYVSEICDPITAPDPSFGENPDLRWCFIPHDPDGFVGDGSLARWNDDGTVTVIDPVAVASSTFSALASGYVGKGVGFAAGWLYFIEGGPLTTGHTVVRLRKMRADGSGLATVATTDYVPAITISGLWNGMGGFRLTPTNAITSGSWSRQDGTDGEDMLFPLDGSGPTIAERSDDAGEVFWGLSVTSGSFGSFANDLKKAADANQAAWSTVWGLSGSALNVDTNGIDAMAYGAGGFAIVRSAVAGIGSAPTTTLASVDLHPTLGVPPNAMFLAP